MHRLLCPGADWWTMVARLISGDVALGVVEMPSGGIWPVSAFQARWRESRNAMAETRTRIAAMLEHERWDRVFSATCIGVPW